MDTKKSALDPWRILLGHLMDMVDSYTIPGIIDRTGMIVDWSMPENERTYKKYRIDTFRPRIISAYDSLPPDDRLRVSHALAAELCTYTGTTELFDNLKRIGWAIEDGSLVPVDAEIKELFFPKGTPHDAYVEIRKIFKKVSKSIRVIDPHIDSTIFIVLKTMPQLPIEINLLTFRIHGGDFTHEASMFKSQHNDYSVEIRRTAEFHDRFIVIDESECWHIGASIKDAGNKAFMISLIEDDGNKAALIKQIENSWSTAQVHNI